MIYRTFIFEYLIAGNLILQVYADLDPEAITWCSLAFDDIVGIIFLILFIMKYTVEGNRMNSIIYLVFQIIALSNRYLFYNYSLNFISGLLAILYCYSIYYFPVFCFPNNSGQYRVGYKTFKVADIDEVAVFYPTRFHTHDTYWVPNSHFWENIYETSKIDGGPHPPKIIYKFITSFLQFIKMNVEVNSLLEAKKEPQSVIILSHALAGSMNSYSILAGGLASNGYIVFCPNHKEEIHAKVESFHELRKIRTAQLVNRTNTIRNLVDFLYDKKAVSRLFFQSNLHLNYETLSLAGHGFGGTTCIFTAFNDARIKGACLCLDPWMWPIPDDILTKSLNRTLLSISSSNYWKNHPKFENEERLEMLFKSNINFKGNSLNLVLKTCSHYNFSDFPNLMPRENVIWGLTNKTDNIHEEYKIIGKLIYHFLCAIDIPGSKMALLEKFRDDCGKTAADENLIIKNQQIQ